MTEAYEQQSRQLHILSAENEGKERLLISVKKDLAARTSLVARLSSDIGDKDKMILDLSEKLSGSTDIPDIQNNVDVVPDSNGTGNSIAESLSAEISQKDSQIDSLTADLLNRDGQIEALKSDIVRRAAENVTLSDQLENMNAEIDTLRNELSALKKDEQAFADRTAFLKRWFISSVSGSSDDFSSPVTDEEAHSVLLHFKVRSHDNPNVRKDPGTSGRIIGHALASREYEVLDISPGMWFMIRLENGKTGWISSKMGAITDFSFSFESK